MTLAWVIVAVFLTVWVVRAHADRPRRRRGVDLFDVPPAVPYSGPLITPTGAHLPADRRLERLEAAASVPMDEIIRAAEWRAEHPDEPEPKVLADLDPATWERPVDAVEHRFKQLQRSGQTMVLPPGMDYQVIPVIRANRACVGLCPRLTEEGDARKEQLYAAAADDLNGALQRAVAPLGLMHEYRDRPRPRLPDPFRPAHPH